MTTATEIPATYSTLLQENAERLPEGFSVKLGMLSALGRLADNVNRRGPMLNAEAVNHRSYFPEIADLRARAERHRENCAHLVIREEPEVPMPRERLNADEAAEWVRTAATILAGITGERAGRPDEASLSRMARDLHTLTILLDLWAARVEQAIKRDAERLCEGEISQ